MIQPSTLHDFVLNLLSDPSLKAAFATDAQGTLEQAGLADITAVDVQEVIPLVIDLLPETPAGVPSLEGVYLEGVAEDVLAEGPLGAISQLQAVASQLTSSGLSLDNLTTSSAGLLAVDENALTVWAGTDTADVYGAGALKLDGDFSAVSDVTSYDITSRSCVRSLRSTTKSESSASAWKPMRSNMRRAPSWRSGMRAMTTLRKLPTQSPKSAQNTMATSGGIILRSAQFPR